MAIAYSGQNSRYRTVRRFDKESIPPRFQATGKYLGSHMVLVVGSNPKERLEPCAQPAPDTGR